MYKKAFNAELTWTIPSDEGDGTYYHAELNIYGQTLAIAEAKYMLKFQDSPLEEAVQFLSKKERISGNTMQIRLHFGEGGAAKVKQGFEVLKEGSFVITKLGACNYSPCMVAFIDKFGVFWCLLE
ncbi:MAG: VOC family protein [Oscillospiraceae bacterium]|nr:VOC family protein [Oscillospiraceae bacterium]